MLIGARQQGDGLTKNPKPWYRSRWRIGFLGVALLACLSVLALFGKRIFIPTRHPFEVGPISNPLSLQFAQFSPSLGRVCGKKWEGKSLLIWNTQAGAPPITLSGDAFLLNWVSWSPNERYLVSGDVSDDLECMDVSAKKVLWAARGESARQGSWSPDSRSYSYPMSSGVRIRSASTGRIIKTYPFPTRTGPYPGLAWSPDGSELALIGPKGVSIINAASGLARINRQDLFQSVAISRVAWCPERNLLAAGPYSRPPLSDKWMFFDGKTGALRHSQRVFTPGEIGVWSRSGRYFAVSRSFFAENGTDAVIDIVEAGSWQTVLRLKPIAFWLSGGWSPDDSEFVAIAADGKVCRWNLK